MFFRRMFSRREPNVLADECEENNSGTTQSTSGIMSSTPRSMRKFPKGQQHFTDNAATVLQLTPLWEYIIRTRTLPPHIRPGDMFEEFLERLHDPEWQVRQHALRVLVDVLLVLGPRSDSYMGALVPQLVENLGHPAPTVRKGALDCLRAYLTETAMPETILLQILDIGLNQKITNEPFGGRLTCGVMLSLPALVQGTLHTPKRNFILRTTIDMLVTKMSQVTHQEITLKVLSKLKELIGPREFSEYMSHAAYREFELLCSVYGVGEQKKPSLDFSASAKSWKLMTSFESEDTYEYSNKDWRSSDEEKMLDLTVMKSKPKEKVIMETEIQINEDTLTMRILEEKDNQNDSSSIEGDRLGETDCLGPILETSGLIQVFTDSEVDEINHRSAEASGFATPGSPITPRTPKRVTFGGEVVKMRTPDSDTVTQSDVDEIRIQRKEKSFEKLNELTVEIANDNTQPEVSPRPKSSASPKSNSPKQASPKSPFKRINISPVDAIVSPKTPHMGIEVLHNLQRDPSPNRIKKSPVRVEHDVPERESLKEIPKSWEELGIVDDSVLKDLKSGDWRHRAHAIRSIEEALKSSENLALVQPCLDSLLRTFLSSERNPEVSEDKRSVVMNLISRLPLDNLEERTVQIITGLCRQGGPGSNRVAKALMQRLPPSVIVLKLISDDFLHAKSSRFRENALQMVMYALMTFPSTCFDTTTCVTQAAHSAMDRKKRVRQASLEVLAIMGQVASPRAVLDIVQKVTASRESSSDLCAAVKARLARKQLLNISADGNVQYTLRVPSPKANGATSMAHLGSDIEWIASGVGSVSPTSLKRRSRRCQQARNKFDDPNSENESTTRQKRAPHEILAFGVGVNRSEDSGRMDDSRKNFQYTVGSALPVHISSFNSVPNGKRYANKSCSDSSLDGRSSDSTYASSGTDGRFARQSVTSRFPTMERLNVNGTGLGQSYRNPYDVSNGGGGQGNHYSFNATYPKPNYSVPPQRNYSKFYNGYHGKNGTNETAFDNGLIATYAGFQVLRSSSNLGDGRRFLNVDKYIIQSKPHPTVSTPTQTSPTEIGHMNGNGIHTHNRSHTPTPSPTPKQVAKTPEVETLKVEDISGEDIVEEPKRKEQGVIETPQPPIQSRPDSVASGKSLAIEEELDVDETHDEPDRISEPTQEVFEDLSEPEADDIKEDEKVCEAEPESIKEILEEAAATTSRPRSPTIEEIKSLSRNSSIAKSHESIYERPSSSPKPDVDNKSTASTETSSRTSLDDTLSSIKPDDSIIRRKSSKSLFGKSHHRRISPVKQSIKMGQAELYPQSLTRFEKPKDGLHKTFDHLDSTNWETIMIGLKSMVRLIRYHPETLDNQMHMVCIHLTKSVRNLRSQVARAASQATTEIFSMKSKNLEQECDDLVGSLLHRTADTNRFIRADAYRSLESMCDNLTPAKVLNLLSTRGAQHQNAIVRTTAAKLLNRLADRIGCDKIFSMSRENRDKFIITGANLMLEGSLETRSYAKSLFRLMSDHHSYGRLLLEVIPTRTYRNIEKTLRSIK